MVAYHQPNTLDHALQLLARKPRMTIIAGEIQYFPQLAFCATSKHIERSA